MNIFGAKQHNLKDLTLSIPHGEFTVITGPSGSGKSSLAFHTLYAEGQRRYVETFSPYVRQFLDRMDKPVVDRIDNIPPAIAVEQKNNIRTTRSTVGTLTELNDYLKVIFPKLARAYDPNNGREIKPDSPASIIGDLLENHGDVNALITFSIPAPSNSSIEEIFVMLEQQGYLRILVDGKMQRTDEVPGMKKFTGKEIEVIQDRVKLSSRNRARLHEAIEAALSNGKGNVMVVCDEVVRKYSTNWTNPETGFTLAAPTAAHFSFNSPIGACEDCRGFGKVIGIDLHKAIQDPSLSLKRGAVKPFQTARGEDCQRDMLNAAKAAGVPTTTPWHELTKSQQNWVIQGENGDADELWRSGQWYGVRGFFDWMESKAYKMHVRVFLANYRAYTDCKSCDGTRLKPYAQCFFLNNKTLPELWQLPLTELKDFFDAIPTEQPNSSTKHALTEIKARLHYLNEVGLGYLTLDRPARTLSGGEIERVNLTTCLGAALTNTLFVLDEPTVGLHSQDIHRLIKVMHDLRDKGNTVVVVEHEEAVMKSADNLIDIGPRAGEQGGNIVAQVSNLGAKNLSKEHPESLTVKYLTGEKSIPVPARRRKSKTYLTITGAHQHNIKDLSVKLPIGIITCLTGLSGSGKSTLANDIIYNNILDHLHLPTETPPAFIKKLAGIQHIGAVERIDQSPLTRTPRSTPAVYSGAFDAVRELFASQQTTQLKPGYFSFNSGAGRCERCMGNGFEKVEMQFLSDLYITCPECEGSRYGRSALKYTYLGLNIAETLKLTVTEALCHFLPVDGDSGKVRNQKNKIQRALQPLLDVGLGYLRLGQPLNTLSGGESQRIKLCQLLAKAKPKGSEVQESTLLILDEPTTGLHFTDIEKLLEVFHTLADTGHTLLIIEHNLDVIRSADHIIDLGPGAGTDGGNITFTGTPEQLAKQGSPSGIALNVVEPMSEVVVSRGGGKLAGGNSIHLFGARENNLKNIDLSIPRDELVCITGLSGSGKSTIAFDIIFAEGQRRFLDSMSPYARQFAGQMEKPDIDKITGLPPTVAIEQRVSRGGGKSTVGTVTEIYHFLRLLYAKLGTQHCPVSGLAVVSQTLEAIHGQIDEVLKADKKALLLVPLVIAKKGYHTDIVAAAERHGITEVIADGKLMKTADFTPLARYKEHDIYAVHPSGSIHYTEAALKLGSDRCAIAKVANKRAVEITNYSTSRVSLATGKSFEEPDPHHFSFNSPRGWCKECRGYGTVVDAPPARKKRKKANEFNSEAEAEIHQELAHSKDKDAVRILCPECEGARLREESRHILIEGLSISAVTANPVSDAIELLEKWDFAGRDKLIARDILPEIIQRLEFLQKVGLDYLSIDRSADTLSGGESQRIRLAAQLGSNLTGVLYILDEPTIGLHPRDNVQLLDTLETLREKGNSLLVVEHDDETMARADTLLHVGPGAGKEGGEIVTDKKLQINDQKLPVPPRRSIPKVGEKDAWLKVNGCHYNNLRDINVRISLGRLTVITGISGCGKSSLMRGTIAKIPTAGTKKGQKTSTPNYKSKSGFNLVKYTYEVDQTPIGKTSRSCPATYVKIFDDIRKLMAQIPEARMRGYTASRFSFNNAEGQCPDCKGNGRIKLEMDFLPTTYIPCEACDEMRYNPATLEIRYNGLNIGDILRLSIGEAAEFFTNHAKLSRTLTLLNDTGLGYLQLGQPSPTLSGGEAQRIKLVAELTKGRANIRNVGVQDKNLYLIEEPTIGLHAQDVNKLIDVLHRLVDEGHTVVIVEHHTTIMAQADYLIDMGPEAGDEGGTIVVQGKPEAVVKCKESRTGPYIEQALGELE
ncbi:MAG: excinuclease ABC subunit UvrA [Akkermansiaceae bacterium]